MFNESPDLSTLIDVPLSHIPQSVYRTTRNWHNKGLVTTPNPRWYRPIANRNSCIVNVRRCKGFVSAMTTKRAYKLCGCFSNDHDVWDVLCTPVVSDENLCLYGLPNGSWEVDLPVDEVPPELPEPALGINFARDGMAKENWVSLIAVHSDSWLISAAFYIGARFSFDKN
ncbi:PHD finger protein ALFIN-LIKE 6-like [Raphanus sativus]|uniref:PHD finger protein ALFIN-LIKE n=1 Tax=Raphanus sativus TaxID=3726 RepID=A0A9W3DSE0_RAPSA|nr:PHD finger protein ALFIN-LIKE 6-like [Raphanus sativus]